MVIKVWVFAICVVVARGGVSAQQAVWGPSAGYAQVPIWPGVVPDAQPAAEKEHLEVANGPKDLVAGRPWLAVEQVSRPTMTVYSPEGRNMGVAIVVFPGGGYSVLAIDLEGTEVCDGLSSRGITCVPLPMLSNQLLVDLCSVDSVSYSRIDGNIVLGSRFGRDVVLRC